MATTLTPYLSFATQAREAMEFYRSVLGGQLDITPFGAFETPSVPGDADGVMHSQLVTPAAIAASIRRLPGRLAPSVSSAPSAANIAGAASGRGYAPALAEGDA